MTKWGEKIPHISIADLQEKLREIDDDGKAVKRLFTAIVYKQGSSPADIEKIYGISKKNVYLWLDRMEERGLDDAQYDESKPGRQSKLSEEQRETLEETLDKSPVDAGYDVQAWSPRIVQHWIKTHFDVEYTRRHVRRLLDDMELSWRRVGPGNSETDPDDLAEVQDSIDNRDTDLCTTARRFYPSINTLNQSRQYADEDGYWSIIYYCRCE